MPPTSVSQGTPFPCLRALVPPLRLVSAAIWQTVQHRIVTAYGLLDHVITEITEIVPGLLDCRQRCLLCFNFQAQLVLDLCRPGQTIDINTLQPHLDRMQTLSSLLSEEVNNSAEGMSGPNLSLISLIQRLITDPDIRQHFYQEVFPQKYGPKYCKAVELLVMKFLVGLESLLVVPNLQQVANMLGSASSVLAECVAFPLPQELKSLLEHQKDCIKPSINDVLHIGDSVSTAPPLHSMETILIEENTLLKANMLDDYMDTSSREQTVDMATAENARMGFDTKDNMSGGDCVTIQPIIVNVKSEKDVACDIQKMVLSRRLVVVLDPRAVELHLGCNIKVPKYIGHTAAQPSEADMPPAMTTGEDEKVKLCAKTDEGSISEGQSSACINMEKEIAVKTMECTPANEHLRNTCMSGVAPASTMANEVAPAQPVLWIRRGRNKRGVKHYLRRTRKIESKASRTCQACGKTFSRSSHIKRHERTHTGERPFKCPQCEKRFQFQYDLKRHKVSFHSPGLRPGMESPQTPKDKTANNHGYASSAQPLEMSDQEKTALHPRGTRQSPLQGTQGLRSREEVCPITWQECSSPVQEIPSAALQSTIRPNQAVPKDETITERIESTLLQGSDAFEEDKRRVKQNPTRQASEPAVEGIKPILDMLNEAASLEGNNCTNREQQMIKTTKAKETNSTPCAAAVKVTPKRRRKAPIVCPNCKVKFRSKCTLRKHMVMECKVKRTTPTEADAAIPLYETLKENKDRKCAGKKKRADSAFHCTKCKMSFPDATRLVTHNEIHKPRPCTMCDGTFNGFVEVKQHYVDVHQFHGPFPCTFCNRVYQDLKGLIRHERVHTCDPPFKCSKCPKAFFFASGLKLHDRTHTKESPFLCWDCGQGCRTNSALKIHRLCRHSGVDDKHLICEHCGKPYAHKQSLDLHVAKEHAGVRYPCPHCDKLFRSASSLTRHDLTHTQKRPFPCKDCVKSFRSASELKIHVRYHTGERPFKCPECGKGFVQSCYLTAHTRMHSGEKPYQCPTCDRGFKSAATMKRHSLTHTGEKPHKCSVCEMAFTRHELLKAHMRKFHFTMLESRWSPVLPSSNSFRKRRTNVD